MRKQDWPQELAKFTADAMSRPFAWGSHDCAGFAAGWIERSTGERVFLAAYTDALSAQRYIIQRGGMLAAASEVLGPPMAEPMAAGRGDVALVLIDDRECLGVVLGDVVAGPGAEGLRMAPRDQIIAAWEV